jgi:hypothetical protein
MLRPEVAVVAIAAASIAAGLGIRHIKASLLTAILVGSGTFTSLVFATVSAPRRRSGTNGPKGLPFLGNIGLLQKEWPTLQDKMLELSASFGENFTKSWSITLPRVGAFAKHGEIVFITSPESVRYLLGDNFYAFEKSDMLNETLCEFLGTGIFASDGPVWEMHRKVAVKMFTKRLLEESSSIAMDQARKLVAKIDAKAAAKESFDLQVRTSPCLRSLRAGPAWFRECQCQCQCRAEILLRVHDGHVCANRVWC